MNQLWRDAVRPIRADEWPQVKELRLFALRDPAAPIAFLETYERAVAEPESFWRERAEGAAGGTRVRQFVAEGPGGVWSGTVTVLVEEAGGDDVFGVTVQQRQAHIVGVFVRPEFRGSGAVDALFEAAVEWAVADAEVARVRLYVHEDNARAEGFYRRFGFVRSGVTAPMKGDPSKAEVEMVLARQEVPSDGPL
ncbi:GNAT family N-acetyltransferase [Streptomyces sp. NBC_00433]